MLALLDEAPCKDSREVADALSLLVDDNPSTAFELRALFPTGKPRVRRFHASAVGDAAAQALAWQGQGATGVYVTLNPASPDVLSRRGGGVGAEDILWRRWLLIDIDPERPSGTSATDEEKSEAESLALEIMAYLERRGWPEPVLADSGNGWHLLYRINLPTDSPLPKSILSALAAMFDREGRAKTDTSVCAPPRIFRVYGTQARKGKPTPERPHRRSSVVNAPEVLSEVPEVELEALATLDPSPSLLPLRRRAERVSEGMPLPGQAYEDEGDVMGLLGPLDWTKVFESSDGEIFLRRPGKREGHSATYNYRGSRALKVFSSNASPFKAGETYTLFGAYALLHHAGDYSKAARALEAKGYGSLSQDAGVRLPQSIPEIEVTTREWEVNDKAIAALAADPNVYQRGGVLVKVINEPVGIANQPGRPRIVPLSLANLREILSKRAVWYRIKGQKEGE